MRAKGVGEGGFDWIGMGEADDDAPGVGAAHRLKCSNDPRLHLLEALPAREAEG